MTRIHIIALFACALAACVATETGNPPGLAPAAIDGVLVLDDPSLPSVPAVTITGRAGAVEPPEGYVLAWSLQNNLSPARGEVSPDGSFQILVEALPGELVRLQARTHTNYRSAPVDVSVSDGGLGVRTPALPCLSIDPGPLVVVESGSEAQATLRITNACTDSVTRSEARLRSETPGLTVVDDGLTTLAPREVSRIVVRAIGATEERDDIVIFSIDAPTEDQIAISVVPANPGE